MFSVRERQGVSEEGIALIFMARKNNCDHLFPSPTKHKPRFWLQPVLLAVVGHIQNPVQSLGKMLLASVRVLEHGQCEQKPSSTAQLWEIPGLY